MDDIKHRAQNEQDRLRAILTENGVSAERLQGLETIIENTAWMKVKLDDSREAIKNSQIVVSYDNGGGQRGIRENPLFRGYEALWKSYMVGMRTILDSLDADAAKAEKAKATEPKTVLELVRARRAAQ